MKITDYPMLLVGDDPEETVRIQEALSQANLVNPLRIVDSGRKAIAYLSGREEYADRESHPLPALVLLDLTRSTPSGPEVSAWIRSQPSLRGLPVLLLTSSAAEPGGRASILGTGPTSRLVKPVDCDRLLALMKSIGVYWMILDKTHPQAGSAGAAPHRRHVLVVDRDEDFLRSIGESLRRRSPPILTDAASTAEDALVRIADELPSAVVYERGLEEAGSFGFLGQVRAVAEGVPVIVLCPEPDVEFAVEATGKGARGVLVKQIRQDRFSDELHRLLLSFRPGDPVAPSPGPEAACPPAVVPSAAVGGGRRQDTDILGKQIHFQNTSWDLVRAAPGRDALDALIRIYWKPLYFFVRQRGFANEEAKDIVQEFLASALEHGMIPRADPLRGRFRTFLLAALTNFLKDRRRSGGRQKRGGGQAPVSLDLELGEPKYARAVRTGELPETIVDRAWAKKLLDCCLSELKGKPSHLKAFELQREGVDYVSIGKATGLSETAAKTAVHRLRVRLRGILRSHLSRRDATDEEVRRDVAEFATLLA